MKKPPTTKSHKTQDMASEYRFDYKKAKPNRLAARMKDEPLIVMIEPDVANVFRSSEQVNKVLRALISAIPEKK
ncbi:MAG TPA: hypothetical protein VK206_22885 [Anaerolineales bacterium]|nr:hypothetical protein [Anaerolineales bacterium]